MRRDQRSLSAPAVAAAQAMTTDDGNTFYEPPAYWPSICVANDLVNDVRDRYRGVD
jgi:hypothetical protein